jgi:Uncharacterized alpha/beta hydrolase domain (DUF2235)
MGNKGLYNDKCSGTTGDDTQHECEADKVTANVFFDGTLNNYYNAIGHVVDAMRKEFSDGSSSYDNAISNVAHIWDGLNGEKDSPDPLIYVEGIGTTTHEADSLIGYALALGSTGVEEKVNKAFRQLDIDVRKQRKKSGLPAILELNVFGFSRGAAAARLFVHLVNTDKQTRLSDKWNDVFVRVNFVGIFDTVSSHGVVYGNDVAELHLKIQADHAKRVFHLIALDEYRENFPLTNIQSLCNLKDATGKNIGYELAIPGAHSDVGGAYSDVEEEKRILTLTHKTFVAKGSGPNTQPGTRSFVYEQGWYTEPAPAQKNPSIHVRTIKSDYYRVALSLMVDQAKQYTSVDYPDSLTEKSKYDDIEQVRTALREFAKDEKNTVWALNDKLGDEAARKFRHQYLHMSFKEHEVGYVPRFKDDNTLEREVYSA